MNAEFQIIRAGQIIFKSNSTVDHPADAASGAQEALFSFVRYNRVESLFDGEVIMKWVKMED